MIRARTRCTPRPPRGSPLAARARPAGGALIGGRRVLGTCALLTGPLLERISRSLWGERRALRPPRARRLLGPGLARCFMADATRARGTPPA